jgi:hypothetical protein
MEAKTRNVFLRRRQLAPDDDDISPPPLEGEQTAASGRRLSYEERRCEASAMARSAAGGVTALTGAHASGDAEHPTPRSLIIDLLDNLAS